MNHIKIGILVLALTLPALVLAQGSGSTAPSKPADHGTRSAFDVTRSLKCKIVEVKVHTLVVEDPGGKRHEFTVERTTKLKADKKTELAGKKKIELKDLKSGYNVKIKYRAADQKLVEVRVVRSKA
jgi:hypothetical protein